MENLTLVIPAKEEAECLPYVLNEIKKLNLNCKILISLSSNDINTKKSLGDFEDVVIYEQKELGYGNAIIEGIHQIKTKFFCIFNADGSFNPRELQGIYNILNSSKGYKFIFASRYLKDGSSEDDTIVTSFGNHVFSFIGKFFFKLPISDILYTFVMGETEIFKKMNFKNNDFRLCVEMPILISRNGYKTMDVSSNERTRVAGKKKPNAVKDGFLILCELIRLFFKKNVQQK